MSVDFAQVAMQADLKGLDQKISLLLSWVQEGKVTGLDRSLDKVPSFNILFFSFIERVVMLFSFGALQATDS